VNGKRQAASSGRSVDAAFNRVLAAEEQAREVIEDCRRRAAAELAEAERRAEAIAERADRRIRLAHSIADRGIKRMLAEMDAQPPDRMPTDGQTAARVDALAARLADELIGGDG
jgi:F0F1-type ATP synthase membrane subunit b/b'